ncbi:MAG: ATP-binding cassette domain-containing protein [Acidimicrobiia bacterium]|nr:ATP-binding cassette domain-containing protein [Acidimicrobiia bacterium]
MTTDKNKEIEYVIDVKDVDFYYGKTQALSRVNLQAEKGKVLALLGPNGSGKTTLVRILATLLHASSGTATIAGFDVKKEPGKVRSVIGMTGQFVSVDDLLTGRENLIMVGELYHLSYKEAARRADALLEQFSLADAKTRRVKTFSGGMRRRLDLAASLIVNPPIVILDEPTTGLDPRTRIEVWEAIERLVTQGVTVLLTTQYLEEADRLAHKIMVIDKGKMIATGTSDELKDKVGGDVVELTVENDDFETALDVLKELTKTEPIKDKTRGRISIPAPEGVTTLMNVLRVMDGTKIKLHDIGLRRPSLDDVFLNLTGHTPEEAETIEIKR